MPIISIIVAIDENNAIGKDNNLLCYLPNDLKYFKSRTEGFSIIMGRKTFQSLPKGALPNRRNIVITHNESLQFHNAEMCSSLKEAINICKDEPEIFIIGGGTIYNETIKFADRLYLTYIHHKFEDADTYFPEIDKNKWKELWREDHIKDEKHKFSYSFIQLDKINH